MHFQYKIGSLTIKSEPGETILASVHHGLRPFASSVVGYIQKAGYHPQFVLSKSALHEKVDWNDLKEIIKYGFSMLEKGSVP